MGIYERITNLCKSQKITITQLEADAGISPRTMMRWDTNKPSVDKIARVAERLGVTVDYLFSGIEQNVPSLSEKNVTFPILGEVAAGYEHFAFESWDNGSIDIPESWLRGKSEESYFVLRVCGDSMFPTYQDGDIVLVLRQEQADYSGQVVVAVYDDEKATVKRLEFDSNQSWLRLTPINTQYPSVTLRNEELDHFRVLGVPKKLIRNIEE